MAGLWLLRACERLNETRLLPGFIHDRWDRVFGERAVRIIFGAPCGPVTTGMLLGWRRMPLDWEPAQ